MVNVVILHSLKLSKLIFLKNNSRIYCSAWFLETFCYNAVNTCGMISGYVMIKMDLKLFLFGFIYFIINCFL